MILDNYRLIDALQTDLRWTRDEILPHIWSYQDNENSFFIEFVEPLRFVIVNHAQVLFLFYIKDDEWIWKNISKTDQNEAAKAALPIDIKEWIFQ